MAFHSPNPAREQLKAEILVALPAAQEPMTIKDLYLACPSATKPDEVAKVAFDMKKKGLIADGGKVPHPRGSPVNSYRYHSPDDPRIEAAKPIQTEPKIKPTRQPAIKRKPAPGHPFAAPIRPQAAHDSLPRVTRPLPSHLQSTAPQMADEGIHHHLLEEAMSEDPVQYIPDPDAFSLEPSEPEAKEDIDSELVDALMEMEMANLEPKEKAIADMLAMASGDVDDIAAAMSKRHESAPKKVCKCIRLNSLPPLPSGYRFASIVASIFSEHYGETMDVYVVDEGGGPFVKIYTTGALGFGLGDLALIGEAADALIKLLESDHA